MSSIFSFLRGRESPTAGEQPVEPPVEPVPVAMPMPAAPRAATARVLANSASSPNQALTDMLSELESYLDGLPDPSVAVTSVTERALAVGNRRGMEHRGSFAVAELKGGRLDAGVRFQFLASQPDAVDDAVQDLHKRLLAARDDLWVAGFLRVTGEGTSLAEHVPSLNVWRKSADYSVLYEYHYWDTDDAESIIARIPIHSDLEERDSLPRETTIVTDEMVRWDDEGAPVLELAASVGSGLHATGLAILAYLPAGWTGNPVTLARLDRSSTGTPTVYPDWTTFHAAVTDPEHPDRHAQVIFASVTDFCAVFEPAGDPLELGDWDEDGVRDAYHPGTLVFDPPVQLESGDDAVRLSYQDAALDAKAVIYLRAQARRL